MLPTDLAKPALQSLTLVPSVKREVKGKKLPGCQPFIFGLTLYSSKIPFQKKELTS